MVESVAREELGEALDGLAGALDHLAEVGIEPLDARDGVAVIERVEELGRRVDAMRVDLVDEIDRRGLHQADGHHSAKIMIRHCGQLSNPEAARRTRAARALRELPTVAEAFTAGEIGSCQVDRLARAFANRRVRRQLVEVEASFVELARQLSYRHFDAHVTEFVTRADLDGTCDRNNRNHEDRDAKLVQDYDMSWTLSGGCASLQGAELNDIFRAFIDAEFATDWEKALIDHGDDVIKDHLARTDRQRRFDALFEIFQRAASTLPGVEGGRVITNVTIDQVTFEWALAKLNGESPARPDPTDEHYRCSTMDGHPIDPLEAVASALVGHVRRVVYGADSVVIDLSRTQRLYTGSARLAAQLCATECFWPGCHVPVSQCQIGHLEPHCDGGRTSPGNGAPACGKHNRHKHTHGYRAWRDAGGEWHVIRPDGTRFE
ncbi:MAG: HNH endonuclease [Actinomycetia bacterium]|nr:HNH endonuclease [Actinomycetes bacterium]